MGYDGPHDMGSESRQINHFFNLSILPFELCCLILWECVRNLQSLSNCFRKGPLLIRSQQMSSQSLGAEATKGHLAVEEGGGEQAE